MHPRGRWPRSNVQSIAAATHIFSHDVKAKEGEARSVIDAGDRRGRSAVEFANEETIRIYTRKAGGVGEARIPSFRPVDGDLDLVRPHTTNAHNYAPATAFGDFNSVDALALKIV